MKESSESQVVRYLSGSYFAEEEIYKPLLECLYEKRGYET